MSRETRVRWMKFTPCLPYVYRSAMEQNCFAKTENTCLASNKLGTKKKIIIIIRQCWYHAQAADKIIITINHYILSDYSNKNCKHALRLPNVGQIRCGWFYLWENRLHFQATLQSDNMVQKLFIESLRLAWLAFIWPRNSLILVIVYVHLLLQGLKNRETNCQLSINSRERKARNAHFIIPI